MKYKTRNIKGFPYVGCARSDEPGDGIWTSVVNDGRKHIITITILRMIWSELLLRSSLQELVGSFIESRNNWKLDGMQDEIAQAVLIKNIACFGVFECKIKRFAKSQSNINVVVKRYDWLAFRSLLVKKTVVPSAKSTIIAKIKLAVIRIT